MMFKKSFCFLVGLYFSYTTYLFAGHISFLVIDADSYIANKAIYRLKLPPNIDVKVFTYFDISTKKSAQDYIKNSDVIIVDVMMPELAKYVMENINSSHVKVYALRGSRDDDKLKKKGFIFDSSIQEYFKYLTIENIQNLLLKVVHCEFDSSIVFNPPNKLPRLGIYHFGTTVLFRTFKDYISWYKNTPYWTSKGAWIGIPFFSASLAEGQREVINYFIKRLEKEGFNVVACFGKDSEVLKKFFIDPQGKSRVDLILTLSLKFYSAMNKELRDCLMRLNIPVINGINLYSIDIDKWRNSPIGIPPLDVVWTIANPEMSGLIEPTPISGKVKLKDKFFGKEVFVHRPILETFDLLIPRIKKWLNLKNKENKKKRIAIFFYNHSQGKQKIGASYLNVFKSLHIILKRMQKEGYLVGHYNKITEEQIKHLILSYARNVGSWAPGELDRMVESGEVIELPISTYIKWFKELPLSFRKKVLKQWGRPKDSNIMTIKGKFIIPGVEFGNVILLPEPARGWGDDPMKLYHDPTLYPHHQYIAVYLWLKKVFKADAMIHLGTHATHEWLPGKQAGLCPSCPPEVLITDIPNIYPYIVDDVGEGIQAKRRGRGVIIDHLIPPLRQSGLYYEYTKLYDMINNYNRAVSLGSITQKEQLKNIVSLVKKLGILKDLGLPSVTRDTLEKIEHYLLEIRESFMPYGLHTFGISPKGKSLDETVEAILKNNPHGDKREIKKNLSISGSMELNSLMNALDGGYILSGEGNDPLRNIGSIPTGKNFYGFNPEKIPTPSAWELGKMAAEEIIKKKIHENGKYPEKVAVVLWATETIRNGGINESTILYLMGLKPVWDKSGRVVGTRVISGRELKRPRIDVLINPSGLYRDLFPNMILFLDKAVQQAAAQRDIENLIAKHNLELKKTLIEKGISPDKADFLARIRIFSEKPGSYGTGVSEMTGNSGFWKSDKEIVKVYENRVGYGFGLDKWGEDAFQVFRENLRSVDVAIHSISSNVYGTMDNDDMFQYLGGLNLAIKKEAGKKPLTLITMQRISKKVEVEDIAKTLGREMRVRYLNPKWIEGMKKEDYAGAREMANFVEYMWGWQVTTPSALDKTKWKQVYEVYVKDKYHLGLKEFFNRANPWAYQSITARMLEAIRKGYWIPDESIKRKLAVEYAVSVVDRGVACCDHTCNNPLLNQMVVNIISLPGIMSPNIVEKFKIAIKRAMKKDLVEQVAERKDLHKRLVAGFKMDKKSPKSGNTANNRKSVEGFKIKEIKSQNNQTQVSSSGVQWFALLFVIFIIGAVFVGTRLYR